MTQNSELFRRGVLLPLDDTVECGLRSNHADAAMHADFLTIGSELVAGIWTYEVLQAIGEQCGVEFADYGETLLEAQKMAAVIAALETVEVAVSTTLMFARLRPTCMLWP